jgi:hypothetical protein
VIAFSAAPSYGVAAPSLHADTELKKRITGKHNMFRNTSIRGNITFVITAFVVILLIVIGVSVGMLKQVVRGGHPDPGGAEDQQ